jgi:hypothetical protein
VVSVTIWQLKIMNTHTNRYLGDCAPDITVIPIGYVVSGFNAVLVLELQVGGWSLICCDFLVCHSWGAGAHNDPLNIMQWIMHPVILNADVMYMEGFAACPCLASVFRLSVRCISPLSTCRKAT